jgi:L-lactate utilization protein LutC
MMVGREAGRRLPLRPAGKIAFREGSMDYTRLASEEAVGRVAAALGKHSVAVVVVKDRHEAREKLMELIPEGAEIFPGTSTTLTEIGFTEYLQKNSRYNNLRGLMAAEPDAAKRGELRRRTIMADYFIGSVHAITEAGEVVTASRTGSQIGPYASGARHVIWVAGTQKIVPTLADALRRVREHSLPLEDARMKSTGASGSSIGKILIFEDELQAGRVTLLLVREKLGF